MDDLKLEAKKQWNKNPCGSKREVLEKLAYGSLEWFDQVRRIRYEVDDPWIQRCISFKAFSGKKLLEVGHGIGTDLLEFCKNGAEVYGYHLALKNFHLHGQECTLKLCDAAQIDFPSEYFDVVYSMGVLHHTPDTIRCIGEIYRVLKPNGHLILGLYHTYSAFHIFSKLLYQGLLKGDLNRLGYYGLMSTLESGADGVEVKPLVKTYSQAKLRYILADFSKVTFQIAHFKNQHIPKIGILLPHSLEEFLEPFLGWYIIASATK